MIRQLIACAKYPGNPLFRLCSEMKWGIQFAQYEIDELEKYVSIAGPLETLFSALNSDQFSTIQRVYPSLKVNKFILCKVKTYNACFIEYVKRSGGVRRQS